MEIEKKYKICVIPENLEQYEQKKIEQGYLCTDPVVRIRKSNNNYQLTYKSKIGLKEGIGKTARVCNEIEVPLNKAGYYHLKEKIDGNLIYKTRYIIPLWDGLKAELDIFEKNLDGLVFVEVEFPDEEIAGQFVPPKWFGEEVSFDNRYANYYLSTIEKYDEF